VRALLTAILVLAGADLLAQDTEPASILVSRQLAASEGLEVGQIVQLAPDAQGRRSQPFRVVGIYEPVPDPSRLGRVPREVRLHLPDLLALTREPNVVAGTEHVEAINIALVQPADARSFTRDVNARVPGAAARPTSDAASSAAPFRVIERFHLAIALVTILSATVFLLALTIMLVDERRETVGVLRLIGLPVRRVLMQVVLEGFLIAGAGGVFGLLLALTSERFINAFFQWRYDTALVFVRVTPDVAALCLVIAVPLGSGAMVAASWALLRRNALRLARR